MTQFKRRIVALFIALALVVGVSGGVVFTTEEPASAHNESSLSYWYCSKHRQSPGMTVTHSRAAGLWPGIVMYYCREDFFGNSFQYWVAVEPPGSNNSWVPWERQHCQPHGIIICQEYY